MAGEPPPHVEPIDRSELYVELLISSRRHAGNGIGARLVRLADELAVERGVEVLRVDCWAGAPTLVGFYEAQGFARSGVFDVRGWKGQVFEKTPGVWRSSAARSCARVGSSAASSRSSVAGASAGPCSSAAATSAIPVAPTLRALPFRRWASRRTSPASPVSSAARSSPSVAAAVFSKRSRRSAARSP